MLSLYFKIIYNTYMESSDVVVKKLKILLFIILCMFVQINVVSARELTLKEVSDNYKNSLIEFMQKAFEGGTINETNAGSFNIIYDDNNFIISITNDNKTLNYNFLYNKDANTLVYDGATLNGVKNVDAESVNTLIILPLAYDVANLQGYSYEQFVSLVGEQTNLTLENDGISFTYETYKKTDENVSIEVNYIKTFSLNLGDTYANRLSKVVVTKKSDESNDAQKLSTAEKPEKNPQTNDFKIGLIISVVVAFLFASVFGYKKLRRLLKN